MAQKKLQKDSDYAYLDLDGDGVVTDEELDLDERMMRLENEDKKEDEQRYMSEDSVLLVLSNTYYDMKDYIEDYEEFKKLHF